jgi:hypothetical protein
MKKNPDFIIIPHQLILDENLQPIDRILYGVIYWLVHLRGEKCMASNTTLKELCGAKNQSTIAHSLIRLENRGYILRRFYDENKKQREEIIPLIRYGKDFGVCSNKQTVCSNEQTGVCSNEQQNNTSNKEENINNILAVASATAEDIVKVIDFFREVSPFSYKDWFKNKTERKAAAELFARLPMDTLEVLVTKFLPKLNTTPYVSKNCKAFKPSELLRNLDAILAKIRELQQKRSQEKINIVI